MKTIGFCLLMFWSLGLYCQVPVRDELPLTYANIAKKAADKWPGDYQMQKYTIDNQCKALNDFLKLLSNHPVPKDIYTEIEIRAFDKWADGDLLSCYKQKDTGAIDLDATFACTNADWEMIVYTMNQQFDAYNSLK